MAGGKKKGKDSAGTPAIAALEAAGVAHSVHAYEHAEGATDFGAEAARELGVESARVFKTLVVDLGNGRDLGVAVVPVSGQLDLKAAATALGVKKVAMAEMRLAAARTGYVPGGISPLGQRKALPTAVDASALEHPTVFVSGGRRGLDVELAGPDLVALTRAVVAPLAAP